MLVNTWQTAFLWGKSSIKTLSTGMQMAKIISNLVSSATKKRQDIGDKTWDWRR